jgi:PAS domain S-box-containing protein
VGLLDTTILGGALVVLLCAVSGLVAWRSGPRVLEAGPYWWWAWAALLISGVAAEAGADSAYVAFVSPVVSPVFTAFLLAGALRYSQREIPVALLPAFVAIGLLRAIAELQGWGPLSGALSLAVEPTGAALAAWLVYDEGRKQGASWPHRLMPVFLAAIALCELLGAWNFFVGTGRLIMWPLWLAATLPLLGLQLVTGMQHADEAAHDSRRDREISEQAMERLGVLATRIHDVISEIGPDGRIAWVSDSCREVFGVGPDDLIGQSLRQLARRFDAHDVEIDGELLGGPSWGRKVAVRTHVVRDAQGERHWVETQIATEAGEAGAGRTLAVTRDVTDRMLAQRATRVSEERFRTFSLLGSDYCYMASGTPDGRVENWVTGSLEQISGYNHDELQAMGFEGFMHPDDLQAGRDRVLGLLEHGGESSHEFRLLTRDGETRFISEKILVERDGEEFRIFGAARDVTDQRRLEQALSRAQKLESLGLLAGGIAHDFNNLLTVILGNTEIALGDIDEASETHADLESVVEAVGQARSLTQQLLAYAGRGGIERVPVDLSERVRSVSELLAAAVSTGVELELDLADDLAAVVADPGEVQQLTMNLVMNAIEACEGDGHVRVATGAVCSSEPDADSWIIGELRPDARYVVLEVSDNGVGMTPETVERVFDPFFTTKTAGRGLGLAAVIGIVRSIDGGVRVESQPGKGAAFSILVPASEQEAVAATVSRGAPEKASGRILVVDDDERVLEVAARTLRGRGFEVVTANSGAGALEAFAADDFDLVLLDAVMPGMSGADTFDALREIRPDAVVLMASGFDLERAVGDLLDRGLAGFIGKPFRADDLVSKVIGLVELSDKSSG